LADVGWIINEPGGVFIYYASSNARMNVATSDLERLIDCVMNTLPDALAYTASLRHRLRLIEKNHTLLGRGEV